MLNLNLPDIDAYAEPAFADSSACAHWISQFQLTDIRQAHHTLLQKLWQLNRAPLPPVVRLKITEQLRDTVSAVQSGFARKIIGKPLPLNEVEFSILEDILSLWSAMAASYGHCLNASVEGDQAASRHLALICQRSLRYTGSQIVEYMLMQHQVDSSLWLQLHQLYLFSEEKHLSTFPVLESLKLYPPPTSSADHFIHTLLMCQADPYELTRKQFQLVNRWLDEWVSWVRVTKELPPSAKEFPPLLLDLSRPDCIQERVSPSPFVRYLDVTELGKNLRIKIALLQQGQMPSQLGLGEEFSAEFCISLIERLHRNWCEGRQVRKFERRNISHPAELCFGLPAVHYQVSGETFSQPGETERLTFSQHEEIMVFGHVVTRTEEKEVHDTESWNIQDENSKGFELIRNGREGQRVSAGHLVGIRPEGGEIVPCVIRWVIGGLDGSVNVGLRLLEGRPEAVAIRPTGINLTVSTKYVQAILLHSGEWSSLIMPKGWFSPGRIIEVLDKDRLSMELRLEELVGKGADYERATFSQP